MSPERFQKLFFFPVDYYTGFGRSHNYETMDLPRWVLCP